jgi:hypothetical protein
MRKLSFKVASISYAQSHLSIDLTIVTGPDENLLNQSYLPILKSILPHNCHSSLDFINLISISFHS